MLISDIYHPNPKVISHTATVKEALKYLVDDNINGLIVLNEKKKVVGVLALQDIAGVTVPRQFRKNIAMASAMYRKGFFSQECAKVADKKITEVMRKDFIFVGLDENIMAVTADFLRNDLYIVPVIEKGELVGVVTRSEIKHALAYGMDLPSKYWKQGGTK